MYSSSLTGSYHCVAPVSYTHLDVYKRQYHDSAVQLSVGIMPHDAGVEAPAVVFGLGDDFYGFGLGGAGDGRCV